MQAKFPKYIVKIFIIGHSKSDFQNLPIADGKFFINFDLMLNWNLMEGINYQKNERSGSKRTKSYREI